ncbi:MAG: segregation/condensation protein A [Clostridia bacterium]|nr:segregation/condensation protein A [Clostridia bacterium]
MELVFKTETYEGPLDLLLSLIEKNKMSIFDIQISVIFDQYMEYVENMQINDMEIAGEFIRMAAELMLIKSKMLLPKQDEDPREDLVRTLMEYKAAKEAAEKLSVLEKEFSGRFEKDTDEVVVDKTKLDDMDIALISAAMTRLIMTMSEKKRLSMQKPIESINPIIKKKIVPIPARVFHVLKLIYKNKSVAFEDIFDDGSSRSGIIATFYAVLVLMSAGRIEAKPVDRGDGEKDVILNFIESDKKVNADGQ